LLEKHENLLILRSFSKGYSLAGLRMGYGLGNTSLINPLMKTKDSYNTDLIAQSLADAAIRDQDYASDTWNRVRAERRTVSAALRGMGFVLPESQSNFVLATVPHGQKAESLYHALKSRNILVRYFKNENRLEDKLRITIGTPKENQTLINALNDLLD